MKIKRYDLNNWREIDRFDKGSLVQYNDHIKAVKRLKDTIAELRNKVADTQSVWLLYAVNYDNRSGEEFFHAFVGKPSYEEFIKVLHVSRDAYAFIARGEVGYGSGSDGYFMRKQ